MIVPTAYITAAKQLLPLLLLLPIAANASVRYYSSYDVTYGEDRGFNVPNLNGMNNPVRLAIKTTNMGDDSIRLRLRPNGGGTLLHESRHGDDVNFVTGEKSAPGGNYQLEFMCRDVTGIFKSSTCEGTIAFKLINCGCPRNNPRIVTPCVSTSFEAARDAVCGQPNCPPGEYAVNGRCELCDHGFHKAATGPQECTKCRPGSFAADLGSKSCTSCLPGTYNEEFGATSCIQCPLDLITGTTASVDYSAAAKPEDCGRFASAGYWTKAAEGNVNPGGTELRWTLSREEAASTGLERSERMAEQLSTAMGRNTYMETTTSVGWSAGASFGIDGIGVSYDVSMSVDQTSGSGESFEIRESVTQDIGRAVTQVVTTSETDACEQSCAHDSSQPEVFYAIIYNWVQVLVDADTGEYVHYVRTCSTWCKYDLIPPQCPPGRCANKDCSYCLPGTFAGDMVDELASTANDGDADNNGDGGDGDDGEDDDKDQCSGGLFSSCSKG